MAIVQWTFEIISDEGDPTSPAFLATVDTPVHLSAYGLEYGDPELVRLRPWDFAADAWGDSVDPRLACMLAPGLALLVHAEVARAWRERMQVDASEAVAREVADARFDV